MIIVAKRRCGCVVAAWFPRGRPEADPEGCAEVVAWLRDGLRVSVAHKARIGAYKCWIHRWPLLARRLVGRLPFKRLERRTP